MRVLFSRIKNKYCVFNFLYISFSINLKKMIITNRLAKQKLWMFGRSDVVDSELGATYYLQDF